jgi:hypothetical protein
MSELPLTPIAEVFDNPANERAHKTSMIDLIAAADGAGIEIISGHTRAMAAIRAFGQVTVTGPSNNEKVVLKEHNGRIVAAPTVEVDLTPDLRKKLRPR